MPCIGLPAFCLSERHPFFSLNNIVLHHFYTHINNLHKHSTQYVNDKESSPTIYGSMARRKFQCGDGGILQAVLHGNRRAPRSRGKQSVAAQHILGL